MSKSDSLPLLAVPADAGAIDEHVETIERTEERAQRRPVAHVQFDAFDGGVPGRVAPASVEADRQDPRAQFGESDRGGRAYAGGAAGHDGDLSGK
jgi:hypothetical protein